jgi:hypothetical protein
MSQAVCRRPLSEEVRLQSQANPREICVGKKKWYCDRRISAYCDFPVTTFRRRRIILANDDVVKQQLKTHT